jgi:hypothetical protein
MQAAVCGMKKKGMEKVMHIYFNTDGPSVMVKPESIDFFLNYVIEKEVLYGSFLSYLYSTEYRHIFYLHGIRKEKRNDSLQYSQPKLCRNTHVVHIYSLVYY